VVFTTAMIVIYFRNGALVRLTLCSGRAEQFPSGIQSNTGGIISVYRRYHSRVYPVLKPWNNHTDSNHLH